MTDFNFNENDITKIKNVIDILVKMRNELPDLCYYAFGEDEGFGYDNISELKEALELLLKIERIEEEDCCYKG